jgi:uncharacterized membrane protein YecN with MAPEG domain
VRGVRGVRGVRVRVRVCILGLFTDTHGGTIPSGVLILVVLDLNEGDTMGVVMGVVVGVVMVMGVVVGVVMGVVTTGIGRVVGPGDVFSMVNAPYTRLALRFRLVHMDDTMFCLLDGGGGATAGGGGGGGGIVLAAWVFVLAASKATARLYNTCRFRSLVCCSM